MMTDNPAIERVLGIFAHPDDPEFFAGATFARWAHLGADITFVIATNGDKGSAEKEMTREQLAQMREVEELNAARTLGVKDVIFLRYPDGELKPGLELRRQLVRIIRLKQPDVVVTTDPTVYWYGTRAINHPDHRAIGVVTFEAVFPTARDRLNFIELERDEGLDVHKTRTVYVAGSNEPTVTVDVTDYIDTKIASLHHHISQISDMEAMEQRLRERMLDKDAPADQTRYIERFRVINLG